MRRKKRKRQAAYQENDYAPMRIRQTRLKYLKTRRKIRKWQLFIVRMHFLCKMALIFLLIWGFAKVLKLPQWYVSPSVLKVYPNPSLEIEGNDITPDSQILDILRKSNFVTQPIYMVDTRSISKKISKLTPVKKVFIRRFAFPARFKVVIEEKTPLISIAPNPESPIIAVFNKDASILDLQYLPLDKKYKTYKIITYDDFHKWTPKDLINLAKLAKTVEAYAGENVVYIDIRNHDDVYIMIDSVNLRMGALNHSIYSRIKKISSVLPQAKKMKTKIKYIDLRWNDSIFIKLNK